MARRREEVGFGAIGKLGLVPGFEKNGFLPPPFRKKCREY